MSWALNFTQWHHITLICKLSSHVRNCQEVWDNTTWGWELILGPVKYFMADGVLVSLPVFRKPAFLLLLFYVTRWTQAQKLKSSPAVTCDAKIWVIAGQRPLKKINWKTENSASLFITKQNMKEIYYKQTTWLINNINKLDNNNIYGHTALTSAVPWCRTAGGGHRYFNKNVHYKHLNHFHLLNVAIKSKCGK